MVEDQGFLDQLKDLLSDSNPMVVANAVAALSEINESSPTGSPLVGKYSQLRNIIFNNIVRKLEFTNLVRCWVISNFVSAVFYYRTEA